MKRVHRQTPQSTHGLGPKSPTMRELDRLELRVPQRNFVSAMEMVARQLGVRFVDGILPLPESNPDPSYPKGLRILYRKFPCGLLNDQFTGPCVSFDVIPVGVAGDPRRLRSYRSYAGTVEESEELFKELLQFLRKIVTAVDRHQRL